MSVQSLLKITAPPGYGNLVTAPSGVGTFHSFGGSVRVWMKASVRVYVRFGTASAATTLSSATARWLTSDTDYVFDVAKHKVTGFQVSAGSGATATVQWDDVT